MSHATAAARAVPKSSLTITSFRDGGMQTHTFDDLTERDIERKRREWAETHPEISGYTLHFHVHANGSRVC